MFSPTPIASYGFLETRCVQLEDEDRATLVFLGAYLGAKRWIYVIRKVGVLPL